MVRRCSIPWRLTKSWCGRGDLNPHAFRRHPLKMVCLPVPPLPHFSNYLLFNRSDRRSKIQAYGVPTRRHCGQKRIREEDEVRPDSMLILSRSRPIGDSRILRTVVFANPKTEEDRALSARVVKLI